MDAQTKAQIAEALRCRFEADALLGAGALPMRAALPEERVAAASAPRSEVSPGVVTSSPRMPVEQALPPPSPLDPDELRRRTTQLERIDGEEVKPCTRCGLAQSRTKTVFGVGSAAARIMFVGEAPGHDEDVSGIPFVGRAGQLLTDMIEKGMGLRREDVYICNVLKCRPPNNRTPAPDEIAACREYLWRQIEIIKPQMIIALGAPAAQTLLGTREGIGKLRGRFHDFYLGGGGLVGETIPLLPTFHPAYLLRAPAEKAKAWADLKLAMARLGIPIPATARRS